MQQIDPTPSFETVDVSRTPISLETAAAPWYRREAWLTVALAAFLPVSISIALPQSWRVPLAVLSGLLLVLAVVLMTCRQRALDAEQTRG